MLIFLSGLRSVKPDKFSPIFPFLGKGAGDRLLS
jgi:hypothetical protein